MKKVVTNRIEEFLLNNYSLPVVSKESEDILEGLQRLLNQEGVLFLRKKSPSSFEEDKDFLQNFLPYLGNIAYITHVIPDKQYPALVRSYKALGLHTDHSRVRYIAWYCKTPDKEGGISILKDGYKLLEQLSLQEKQELQNIYLREHKVFEGDPEQAPILSYEDKKTHFYFTFWLANKEHKKHPVFQKLASLVHSEKDVIKIHLQKGDILIVDNWRTLHGRTEIKNHRHLIRHWII